MFVFNHALVQDVAYESVLDQQPQGDPQVAGAGHTPQGHPAFGTLEPEVLARHSDLGGLTYEAMQNWLAAGHHALRSANNLAAITYLRSALNQLQALDEGPKSLSSELAIQMSLAPACMAIYGWGSVEVEKTCARARELALESWATTKPCSGRFRGLWTNYFLRGELEQALGTALENGCHGQGRGRADAADGCRSCGGLYPVLSR